MPAYGNFVLDKGYDAASAMTKNRFAVLSGTTAGLETVAQAAASNVPVLGVNRFDCTAGDILRGKGVAVRIEGIAEVEVGAAVARGAEVMSDASGRAITAATAGNRVLGIALDAASAVGDRIPVRLTLPGRVL